MASGAAAADESAGPSLMAVLGAMAGVMRGLGTSGLGPFTFGLQVRVRTSLRTCRVGTWMGAARSTRAAGGHV